MCLGIGLNSRPFWTHTIFSQSVREMPIWEQALLMVRFAGTPKSPTSLLFVAWIRSACFAMSALIRAVSLGVISFLFLSFGDAGSGAEGVKAGAQRSAFQP